MPEQDTDPPQIVNKTPATEVEQASALWVMVPSTVQKPVAIGQGKKPQ